MDKRTLELLRPLVVFDLETTGLDVQRDRIVEIAIVKLLPDGQREIRSRRVNPEMPISQAATEVHGIRNEDLINEPTFAKIARSLFELLAGCDLSGFNIERFDLPVLTREFAAAGFSFPEATASIIDSWRIFQSKEPRDLSAALRFYCQSELKDPHRAECDALAAADVLLAQVGHYADLPATVSGLHGFCHPASWLDSDGKLLWKDGEAVLGFGKNRGKTLRALAQSDPEYLRWVAKSNFSAEVIKIVNEALAGNFPKAP